MDSIHSMNQTRFLAPNTPTSLDWVKAFLSDHSLAMELLIYLPLYWMFWTSTSSYLKGFPVSKKGAAIGFPPRIIVLHILISLMAVGRYYIKSLYGTPTATAVDLVLNLTQVASAWLMCKWTPTKMSLPKASFQTMALMFLIPITMAYATSSPHWHRTTIKCFEWFVVYRWVSVAVHKYNIFGYPEVPGDAIKHLVSVPITLWLAAWMWAIPLYFAATPALMLLERWVSKQAPNSSFYINETFYYPSMPTKPPTEDPLSVQRGDYGTNIGPAAFFIVGRLLTGPAQFAILKYHPLSLFAIPPPPSGGFVSILGHRYPRMPFYTALMPTTLSIKHALWASLMTKERMTMPFALFGVLADLTYECVTTLVFSGASINPLFSERLFDVGRTLFFFGVAVELFAEIQRLVFKSKQENRNKPCTSGFWAITRHINYTANVLFGFGVGLATGGPGYSIATSGMYLSNFIFNAMPSIEDYCKKRYGALWAAYEKKVPYQLIPGVY